MYQSLFLFLFAEESDEEDDEAPRKRRRAERAAEGDVEEEEVCMIMHRCLKGCCPFLDLIK